MEPEQRQQIKTLATFAGMSIKDYVLMKTLPAREVSATELLLKHPENAAPLREAISTPVAEHVTFETLEDLEDAIGV